MVTVGELTRNIAKYAKQLVEAKGEIDANLIGARICDQSGCIPIVLPKQDFDLARDSKYLEYQRLCLERSSSGDLVLIGKLRGRYTRGDFVLHKVVNIEALRYKPPQRPKPILGKNILCKVHGGRMVQDNVKIVYGLVKFPKDYSEAETRYFPNWG